VKSHFLSFQNSTRNFNKQRLYVKKPSATFRNKSLELWPSWGF